MSVLFWNKVRKSKSGCWVWTACKTFNGYGQFRAEGRTVRAHRHSYEMKHGPLGEGLMLLHTCDNRACVRPKHLVPGTARENAHDAKAKGRNSHGERHGAAVISGSDVRMIRNLRAFGMPIAHIAKLFGVWHTAISKVVNGKTWRHLA